MNPTYRVHFLGCKANQSDALSVAGILERAGWKEASANQNPSLMIVQTCTVTMSADAQGRQLIRKLKRENPSSKILMTGCYAERVKNFSGADYVVGNLQPDRLKIFSQIAGQTFSEPYPDFPLPAAPARTRTYIKIQDGCDANCSYCIIPSVRGKSRSLPIEEVIRRVEHFRDAGYKEMIFTGISMGGYGKDLSPKTNLTALIRRVDDLSGDFRIRLSSLEPEEIDDEFIETFIASRKFQPHLHLPLQSASDRVLKKMRRQYLFKRYDSIVRRIFAKISDLNLGTDILVGFPNEDHDAFLETYNYVKGVPFAYCHVFPYSSRPDTPAASFQRVVSNAEASDRAAKLRELAVEKNMRYRMNFLGRPLRALVLHGGMEALTDNYIHVHMEQQAKQEVVQVEIQSIDGVRTVANVIGGE
ncbi:MAG: tRNA (N(6)-L-threonylcarbamoyladenosine(37)-C(2))-methylthiotransferase MtaB [Acidobacteria bacterium]|nr:MAG: tRNA (N(6)-L-threonylcarbamoyladenosine(37)-C(2))-methylthiotransferase MtaB [Acidobacteriota bacterium]